MSEHRNPLHAGPEAAVEPSEPRHGPAGPLAIGALGVVFGDIGTSPLYALGTVFSSDHNAVAATRGDVFGVVSLVFWSVMLVVTVKYVLLVMRADNDGEGGILALVGLLTRSLAGRRSLIGAVTMLGIVGAALFYGDSLITPAISVMSSIEGLEIVSAGFASLVLPLSVTVLACLFAIQRFGTGRVGKAFGPVMLAWFLTLAVLGLPHIVASPGILAAVSPLHAWGFMLERPFVAFIALGAIVLCITGAEALYADMGHFGRRPIRIAWLGVVLPCLLINYFGQGAMILSDPSTRVNPFFHLAPDWARLPLVVLATAATIIASQSVISGAFSVSSQASRLGLLPRFRVRHTSRSEGGQIYIGAVNWMLFVGVLTLIAVFRSSQSLATAYGVAVTGTLVLTTVLLLVAARNLWGWGWGRIALVGVGIGGMEAMFFTANLAKIGSGGWLPLLIGGAVIVVMTTWRIGVRLREAGRWALELPLETFLAEVRDGPVQRVPGAAVFLHADAARAPLALSRNVEFNGIVHERVVLFSVINLAVPHVRHVDRVQVDHLGDLDDGIVHIRYQIGFLDSQDVPRVLRQVAGTAPELDFDPATTHYFLSVLRLRDEAPHSMNPGWRRRLFLWLQAREAPRAAVFHLPPDRTVIIGAEVDL